MTTFKHILVPTDFEEASERALDLALGVAQAFNAQVTLLHVTWLPPYYYSAYAEGLAWPTDELEGVANKRLEETVRRAKSRYPRVAGTITGGEAWQRILESASDVGADLIVLGTHGRRGLSRIVLGSVAERVVRLSPIPVLTVSNEAERRARETALRETADLTNQPSPK